MHGYGEIEPNTPVMISPRFLYPDGGSRYEPITSIAMGQARYGHHPVTDAEPTTISCIFFVIEIAFPSSSVNACTCMLAATSWASWMSCRSEIACVRFQINVKD